MTRFKHLKISHMIMISIGIVFVLGAILNRMFPLKTRQYTMRNNLLIKVIT